MLYRMLALHNKSGLGIESPFLPMLKYLLGRDSGIRQRKGGIDEMPVKV